MCADVCLWNSIEHLLEVSRQGQPASETAHNVNLAHPLTHPRAGLPASGTLELQLVIGQLASVKHQAPSVESVCCSLWLFSWGGIAASLCPYPLACTGPKRYYASGGLLGVPQGRPVDQLTSQPVDKPTLKIRKQLWRVFGHIHQGLLRAMVRLLKYRRKNISTLSAHYCSITSAGGTQGTMAAARIMRQVPNNSTRRMHGPPHRKKTSVQR